MVSFAKASSILFFASSIGAHVTSAHKVPEDLDMEAFAARLKKMRADARHGNHPGAHKLPQDTDTEKTVLSAKLKGSASSHLKGSASMGPKGSKSKGKSKGSDQDSTESPESLPGSDFLNGHEFIPPGPGDVRGPCPFINVMANHGFINRNGKNVPVFRIPELATELFDLPSEGFVPIANMAVFDGQAVLQANGETLLDIDDLWNRPGEERDASQVFPNPLLVLTDDRLNKPSGCEGCPVANDEKFVDIRYAVDEDLLQQLLRFTDENGHLTLAHHTEFLKERIMDSRENHFFLLSEESQEVAAGQYTLPVLILGEDVTDFSFAPASHIEGLWRDFRFPEGYAPRSVRFRDAFDPIEYERFRQENNEHNLEVVHEALEAPLPTKEEKTKLRRTVRVATA